MAKKGGRYLAQSARIVATLGTYYCTKVLYKVYLPHQHQFETSSRIDGGVTNLCLDFVYVSVWCLDFFYVSIWCLDF